MLYNLTFSGFRLVSLCLIYAGTCQLISVAYVLCITKCISFHRKKNMYGVLHKKICKVDMCYINETLLL